MMKFYDREKELQLLQEIEATSREYTQMTVLVGRRRIGKTKLLLKAIEGKPAVYLFVSRKSESILCREFVEEAERALNMPIGPYTRIAALLEHLMHISQYTPFTLIMDEFQELQKIDPAIIGDIQRVWDLHKDSSRLNLVLSGSVYYMMKRIFEDEKEPLFSRASHIIHLKAFSTETLKTILADHNPHYTQEDLLALYMFTGGVAWYVELLMTAKAWTWEKMIGLIFKEQSLFVNEGKNLLIEEIGKEYSIYFSILECIARGINTRGDIENTTNVKEIGGYLNKLEKDFGIIAQLRPIFSKPAAKSVKYHIADNFLTIWFRFIYKYMNYVESGNFTLLRETVMRDYPTCSGIMLERYFRQQAKESGRYTDIGNFWDKKGGHEIDIILVNEQKQLLRIGEIKRQEKNIDTRLLQEKADYFLTVHPELQSYTREIVALSMQDM